MFPRFCTYGEGTVMIVEDGFGAGDDDGTGTREEDGLGTEEDEGLGDGDEEGYIMCQSQPSFLIMH